jgi:hypothetical protein
MARGWETRGVMRAVMSGHGELVWPCNEGVRGVRGCGV